MPLPNITVPTSDASQSIINELFGVDRLNILSVDKTSLFNYLFSNFNTGLLTFGFVIYAFIVIAGTINTARDGTFLGKNWDSFWIPIRVVMGSISVIPYKSGYCLAQYLVFIIVAAGTTFADNIWSKVNSDITNSNVPPIVSTSVTDTLKNDIALYMLGSLTKAQLVNFNAGHDLCEPIAQSPDNVRCNVKIDLPLSSGFIQQYAQQINTAMSDSKNGLPINTEGELSKGLLEWSGNFSKDGDAYYYKYKLNKAYLNGTYDIDMSNVDKAQNINGFSQIVSGYLRYVPNNMHEMTALNSIDSYSTDPLQDNSSQILAKENDAISILANGVVKGLEEKSVHDKPNQHQHPVDTSTGWWNADQQYLNLDKELSENLTSLYDEFNAFNNQMSSNYNESIKVNYQSMNVGYYYQNTKVKKFLDAIFDDKTIATTYNIPDSLSPVFTPNVPLKKDDMKLSDFANSMQTVRNDFQAIIQNTYKQGLISQSDQNNAIEQVKSLLQDGMSFQYAQYMFIISNMMSALLQQYFPNTQTGAVSTEYYKISYNAIVRILALLQFFSNNNINFLGANADNTQDPTPAAQQILNAIFSKLGISNQDMADEKGLLADIYKVGMPDKSKEDQNNIVSLHLSQLQDVQSIGINLIEGTIVSATAILDNATRKLNGIAHDAQRKADEDWGWGHNYGWFLAEMNPIAAPAVEGYMKARSVHDMMSISIELAEFSLSLMWLPMVFFVLVTIFTIGVTFSLLIPLTPFLLFWAGKISWLLLMIEALVAAPIMALGIVYPEGHELFGKSQPGIQMVLALMLRPVFMIVGLFVGMTLTYVVIRFSADGFHIVADQIMQMLPPESNGNTALYTRGVICLLIVFTYASFIGLAFNKCFSPIYLIPDKVLQWIGGQSAERAGVEDVQEIKGSVNQNAHGLAQAGEQSIQRGIEAEKGMAETKQKAAFDEGQANWEQYRGYEKSGEKAAQEIEQLIPK